MKKSDLPKLAVFHISDSFKNEDSSFTVVFDLNEVFRDWFKQLHSLRRWSNRKFEKVILESFSSNGFSQKIKIVVNWVDEK